ncbi:hypothetical protein LJK88_02210 [Paenibacillus sp. P26]|nr:hypothetical protein LJK88_02210 [Paenibacillus sp. P26]
MLVKAGVAVKASDDRDLKQQLLEPLENRQRLGRMRAEALHMRSARSAERAVEAIVQLQTADSPQSAPAAVAAVARML